jgi:hypothetical protein
MIVPDRTDAVMKRAWLESRESSLGPDVGHLFAGRRPKRSSRSGMLSGCEAACTREKFDLVR